MKNKFPGFYHPKDTFFDMLFRDAIIILDTNILLDLYRVSPKTSKELIEIIKKLGERIWIPYQVALEYHKDLFSVVEGQIKKYSDATKAIESIQKTFLEKRSHPFLSDELYESATGIFDNLIQFFDKQKNELENIIMNNSVKDELCELLNTKVGECFNLDDLQDIYREGEERIKEQTPPGFKDNNKPNNDKYGDLVVWKEIIRKAKEDSKPVLFVTDDTKEDWFMKFRGKTYGPHPLLLEEFQKETGQQMYIYTLDRFLENSEKLEIQVTDTALDEIKARKEIETTEAVSGQISLFDECQSESSNEEKQVLLLNGLGENGVLKGIANRKGQVGFTLSGETEGYVGGGYTEDGETNS